MFEVDVNNMMEEEQDQLGFLGSDCFIYIVNFVISFV